MNTFDPGQLGHEALAYASKGFIIFPLWWTIKGVCQCRDRNACNSPGKHSRIRHSHNDATSDPRQVEAWWAMWPEANIGLPAGRNGLAIIDVDPRHGGDETLTMLEEYCMARHNIDMMATRVIRTGSGGLHLYYRAPAGGIPTKARTFGGDGVDTRGGDLDGNGGGYVVAPPSVHACGGRYEVLANYGAIAPWPEPLTALIESQAAAEVPSAGPRDASPRAPRDMSAETFFGNGPAGEHDRAVAWALAALDDECRQLRTAPNGSRNANLNIAAYKMGRRVAGGLLDEAATARALYHAASMWIGHQCSAEEIRKTIASGMRAGKERPVYGPSVDRVGRGAAS